MLYIVLEIDRSSERKFLLTKKKLDLTRKTYVYSLEESKQRKNDSLLATCDTLYLITFFYCDMYIFVCIWCSNYHVTLTKFILSDRKAGGCDKPPRLLGVRRGTGRILMRVRIRNELRSVRDWVPDPNRDWGPDPVPDPRAEISPWSSPVRRFTQVGGSEFFI